MQISDAGKMWGCEVDCKIGDRMDNEMNQQETGEREFYAKYFDPSPADGQKNKPLDYLEALIQGC